ncbi:MAG TPA: undecaprenyldiphospho-muramoylpentapeptide beta-N-acetylglucosaminyltransferase [Verrucomicrobiae bacterium]|nr:undecaprenyldiphospho-muramoylpentapeptide beta-N-acetylglucosaminyltransferase [Verrucomicrobiae bacterium]
MQSAATAPLVAIACGGTGGHLFPGLAVAEVLLRAGCAVSLIVSPKEVDQQAVKAAVGMDVITLPAVGLSRGRLIGFLRGFWQSCHTARKNFKMRPPTAVLAMGGFTSAPPILAGRKIGAATYLHESNSIPGRANRWLAPKVDGVFTGFAGAGRRLRSRSVTVTGTPVRPEFRPMDAGSCRVALALSAEKPVLLVMGGSQGATGINKRVLDSLPLLSTQMPELQFLHLTGAGDFENVRGAYASRKLKAVVRPFLSEMELALGAATVAISRAGASSLAEIAAMRLPAVLIPYPAAADNHQFSNAQALVETGAARMLEQRGAMPETLVQVVKELVRDSAIRESIQAALTQWHRPDAAGQIAAQMLEAIARNGVRVPPPARHDGRGAEQSPLHRRIDPSSQNVSAEMA